MTTRADMEAVIEAVLFVANDPVSRERLASIFGEREEEEAKLAVEAVVQRYLERPECGILIDEVAGGLRLVSRPDLHDYLRKFFEVSSANKLSMPALETLAIVAYRQPVTAPEIQELRGVNSQGVLKTLLERRLVRIAGRKEVVGKPFLYATTREFLLHFGLRSLKELPPLEQFEEMFGAEAESADDPSAEGDAFVDAEEEADREAAEIQEDAEAEADEARRHEEEWQREEEEARQQAQEAEEGLAAAGAGRVGAGITEETADGKAGEKPEASGGEGEGEENENEDENSGDAAVVDPSDDDPTELDSNLQDPTPDETPEIDSSEAHSDDQPQEDDNADIGSRPADAVEVTP